MTEKVPTLHLVPNFLIGISGKAGHGKDSIAKFLSEEFRKDGVNNYTLRFADALKDAYSIMFSIEREKLEDLEFKKLKNPITGTTHREELQFLGTEAYRDRTGNPDVWVEVLAKRLDLYTGMSLCPVFVPDVRFENEARFIKQNGYLIKVIRDGQEETINSGHISEQGFQTKPDIIITNDGSLELLKKRCSEVYESTLDYYFSEYKQHLLSSKDQMFAKKNGLT